MSGNKCFLRQAQSFDAMDFLQNTSGAMACQSHPDLQFSLEKTWHEVNKQIREKYHDEEISHENIDVVSNMIKSTQEQIDTDVSNASLTERNGLLHSVPSAVSIKMPSEIRMQEIEEIIMENAVFRNIDGNLCVWNGRFYKQLSVTSFAQEVRKLMPQAQQNRISRFSRFKEAYDYMLANEKIKQKFTSSAMSAAKHMIVFKNGMYEAEENELIPSTPKYPVLFDINANYVEEKHIQTPYMDSIINQATNGDQEVLKRFYQCLGYICAQGNEAKKFFVFGTAPDSGKSIIGEFLGKLLGADHVSSISLNSLGGRFALGTINQKVLNYNMDLPAAELDTGVVQKLKQLTGDARIDCEEKYVQGRTVKHHCKFLFATNHPIRLRQEDDAFYRRLLLIPFISSVEDSDKDYHLAERIWEERDAIATKAAHAYRKLYQNNYMFEESQLADSMLDEWRCTGENAMMKQFFNYYFEVDQDDHAAFMPTDLIFKAYQEYCSKNGENILESDKPFFSKKFRNVFPFQSAKRRVAGYNSPVNGYLGIRLREQL